MNVKTRNCLNCNKEISSRYNRKACSEICRKAYRNEYKRQLKQKNAKEYICRHCKKIFVRYRKRNGFCSRSCASKMYIADGTYDEWRSITVERKGINKHCFVCKKLFYCEPSKIQTRNLCGSKECRKTYMSDKMSGENNPFYGVKHNKKSMQKQKETLMSNHGVSNGYDLAKHKTSSKAQLEIFNKLKNIFPHFSIEKEKRIGKYRVDIIIDELKTIVEYNGSYWHADPRKYKKDYFHKKKGLLAEEIWKNDKLRLKELKALGYNVIVVWEDDYLSDKKTIFKEIKERINGIK